MYSFLILISFLRNKILVTLIHLYYKDGKDNENQKLPMWHQKIRESQGFFSQRHLVGARDISDGKVYG